MSLPILKAPQIREWDAYTIAHEPISSIDLMERAASRCLDQLIKDFNPQKVIIFCGVGNNGGDGLVMARLLSEMGIHVQVYVLEFSKKYSPDIKFHLNQLKEKPFIQIIQKNEIVEFTIQADVVVDAIFGSGLNRPVEDEWLGHLIQKINQSPSKVVAVDIPSGLFCWDNSTNPLKYVIQADVTYSFQTPKRSFLFADYEKYVGQFKIIDINLLSAFKTDNMVSFIQKEDIQFQTFSAFAHKGSRGHALFIGGFDNMFGSITLSALSAYRIGAGYVHVKMDSEGITVLLSHMAEAVVVDELQLSLIQTVKAIGIGPGLGTSDESKAMLIESFECQKPMVIDADAINLLAFHPELLKFIPTHSILTPHPKELERLIGKFESPEATLAAQIEFSINHQLYILQKGAYSKLSTPTGEVYVNSTGNPAMGVAGMGDTLTGIITSLLAQGYSPLESAKMGMFIHGFTADEWIKQHHRATLLPTELANFIPNTLYSLQNS